MKNCYKRLISLLFVAVLCVSLSSSAFAAPAWWIRTKAGIAAAALAMNLYLEPVGAAFQDSLANAIDPIGSVLNIHDDTWNEYLDQSVIRVSPNTATIDGVEYSSLWLGPDAAHSLRSAGLDFATGYNIVNNVNESVEYASGEGYIGGFPVYSTASGLRTPTFNNYSDSPFSLGDINLEFYNLNGYNGLRGVYQGSTVFDNYRTSYSATFPITSTWFEVQHPFPSTYNVRNIVVNNNNAGWWNGAIVNIPFDASPFRYDYTSGVIDGPIAVDDGLLIQVPTSFTDPSTGISYDIHDILDDYPELRDGHTINIDPELNPDFQTDIDIGDALGDLINTILNLLDLLPDGGLKFEFTSEQPEPGPEPAPVPDPEDIPDVRPEPLDPETPDTIGETNWNFLSNLLRWIQSTIDNFRIATANALHNIYETLQDVLQSLETLPETILQAIEEGPIKLFRKALDILKDIFAPIFLLLKNALGIWHYVVEWIQSISGPFTWILGIVSGTSSYITLPLYASIAGVIVIAVYRRFGR